MKTLGVVVLGLLVGVAVFPALLAGGDVSPPGCGVIGGDMGAILQTIRTLESGGRYGAQAPGSSASGAYQFIDSTWANFGGYGRAVEAPSEVQDAKAVESVTAILAANNNDVMAVPVVWYIGHVPSGDEWDRVPYAGAGNVLTPRQYQAKWMTIYLSIAPPPQFVDAAGPVGEVVEPELLEPTLNGDPLVDNGQGPDAGEEAEIVVGGCVGGSIQALPGGWSLPIPRELLALAAIRRAHHDYPAWDFGTLEGTPVYAVRGGTVTSVTNYARNWFGAGCVAGGSCSACGVGITITDDAGTRWAYCHGSNHTITTAGARVEAGTQILWSGNTGRSTGPHLHLSIRTADGVRRCPQLLLESLFAERVGIDPAALPATGCVS